jgi:hypothetical protein
MADFSEFSIVTYERKPGHWRAAIMREVRPGMVVAGNKARSIVTPDDRDRQKHLLAVRP